MRSTEHPHATQRHTRRALTAATAAVAALALAGATGVLSGSPASAAAGSPRGNGATVQATLRGDLSRYLTNRRTADHISTVSLRVTFPTGQQPINLATGTTRYTGGPPVPTSALWQIGSNTKAFTSVILLQLEAEGKLSINDPLGKFLPQYPAWRHVTIKQLLNMTSRIPDYSRQPAFAAAIGQDPATRFTAAQLVSYAVGVPLTPPGWSYSSTGYILAEMIIQRVTHDTYGDQLTRRIITPLHLSTLCYVPYTCPAADAARMPAGYFFQAGAPPLLGRAMPPLAETWAQAAGAIVSSLADMTTWDRALYQGLELPPVQQHQLDSLVSEITGKPIRTSTLTDPGYGLGVAQLTSTITGTIWWYEGSALGFRVLNYYFPGSGLLITLAANSSTNPTGFADHLSDLAVTVYRALQKAGMVQPG
jgi:D-alanyl-D-alanine carboxypeptidase